jgi:manganese/iron transport system permease protein
VSGYTSDLFGFLLGNVLGASGGDIWLIGIVAGIVLLLVGLFFKELLFTSYDVTMAAASGIPVVFIQHLLPALIAVTTVVSLKAVGIVLVMALLVTPAATGTLIARRLPVIMLSSVAIALAATVGGLYLSYYLDLPSGPSIVILTTGLFLLALLFSPSKGVAWRWRPSPGILEADAVGQE